MGGESIGTLPESGEEQETMFGEAALLSSAASTLTVTSLEPCKLLALPRSKFRRALALMPNLKEQVRGYNVLRMSSIEATLSARGSAVDAATTQSSSEDMSQEAAATCIQKCQRGKKARMGHAPRRR